MVSGVRNSVSSLIENLEIFLKAAVSLESLGNGELKVISDTYPDQLP